MIGSRPVPLLAVAAQAALLPLAGIPIWFRNEAPYHYLLARDTGFLDSWRSYTPAINRPVVRFAEWAACHLFDANATMHVLWNGLLFVAFAVVLARLAAAVFGGLAGWLSIIVLLGVWNLVFYPVFNAIHGVQYPLELLLVAGALVMFRSGLRGSAVRFAAGVALSLVAFFTHSMSVVVIPAVLMAMTLTIHEDSGASLFGRRGRAALLLLAPLALLLLPLVQPSGAPGGVLERGGMGGALQFLRFRADLLGNMALRTQSAFILLSGALFLAMTAAAPGRGARRVSDRAVLAGAAVAVVAGGAAALLLAATPWMRLTLFLLVAAVAALRDRRLVFLVAWAGAGAGLYLLTSEWSASYYRHFSVPTAVLVGAAAASIAGALWRALPVPSVLRRAASLPRAAWVVTLATAAAVFAARGVDLPYFTPRVRQLEYVKNLSFTFRDQVAYAAQRAAPGDTLLMHSGRSRADEMKGLYGEEYLKKLQPSKSAYYESYFDLFGREDLTVAWVEGRAAREGTGGRYLLTVNAWETERAIDDLGVQPEKEFRRGGVWAALFVK